MTAIYFVVFRGVVSEEEEDLLFERPLLCVYL